MAVVRFGLIPRGGEGDARERELVGALAELFGAPVEIHRAADYRVALSALEHHLVDLAWLPPIVAARALRSGVAEPLAVIGRSGDTSYTTTLVTRPDSPIHGLADLRGLRVAWVDRESASGYAVLRAALARAGVKLTDAFVDESFVRSHDAVARAVVEGRVDVGATCAHLDADGLRIARSPFTGDQGLSGADLRVVFEAGPIPSDLVAVRAGFPARLRAPLERALLQGLPARAYAAARAFTHADQFTLPTPEHRRQLLALLEG